MREHGTANLAGAAATMASNQVKVVEYTHRISRCVDDLVAAAAEENWGEVQRVSEQLSRRSRAAGYRAVSAMAQRVCDEAHRPDNTLGIKRSLIRLIGTCGRTDER